MKVEVELDEEAVDEIVLRELKLDYELNGNPERYFEPDQELLNALKVVIKYHSSEQEYEDWLLSIEEL